MHIINITVRNKVAVNPAQDRYVCGNSDYIVRFDFDAEWDAFDTKTARFIKEDGTYKDQVFSGKECPVPVISDTYKIMVGVFAGNLSTTTAAYVPAKKSILCGGGTPADPEPDVYSQVMDTLNRNTEAVQEFRASVDVGDGGLFLVTAAIPEGGRVPYADRTQEEIRAAVAAGKTCVLVYIDGRVFTYCGEIPLSQAPYDNCPTFLAPGNYKTTEGLEYWRAQVNDSGAVLCNGYKPAKTPNPYALTIKQGDKTTTYNGSGQVTVEIPEGVPDPGKAHQQLVSDASGKAVWQDALAYKYVTTGMVDILKEETLTSMGDDDGDGTDDAFASATPLAAMPEAGKTYEVTINGTQYNSRAYDVGDAAPGIVIGNPNKVDSLLEDTGEPYALCALSPDAQAVMGGATLILVYSADSVTLSIRGEGTVTDIKKIDKDLLPDTQTKITLMIDADGNVMTDTPFATAWAMTNGELQSAMVIVQTGSYGGQPATLEADVQVRRRSTDMLGEALEITFRQYTDPGDAAAMKETTRYIYWAAGGLQLAKWKLYSLPIMDAGWDYDKQTYYLRSVGGVWQPVTIDQLKADLGLT